MDDVTYDLVTNVETDLNFAFVNCLKHMEVIAETRMLSEKCI